MSLNWYNIVHWGQGNACGTLLEMEECKVAEILWNAGLTVHI